MRNRSTARFVNGVISALVVSFFLAHSLLGALEGLVPLDGPATWVMWLGAGAVLVHVAASAVTSYGQLADAEFPPSPRKKRHLLLKWVSGGVLAGMAVAHIVCIQAFGPDSVQTSALSTALALVLVAALAVHSWIGAKSLVTDLGLSKGLMFPFRVAVCALAVVAGSIVLAGIVQC